MGPDLHSGRLAPVFVPKLDACTECPVGGSPYSTNTIGPLTLKLYSVTNPCLMSNDVSESVRFLVGQTKENVPQERELLCICPGNKEVHFEAYSTEHELYVFQFQEFR
jgi:hypothetical protein